PRSSFFFFSSRRRHTISKRDWRSDVCSSDCSSTFFDPLIYFRCSFSFRHKNTPLDNHIQRGETSQLFYKHRDFVLNIASFLQTSRLYFKPTIAYLFFM